MFKESIRFKWFPVIGIALSRPHKEIARLDEVVCKSHQTYPLMYSLNLDRIPSKSELNVKFGVINSFSIKWLSQTLLPVPTSL